MAVKIRLQRQGKKGKAFFHIVAADTRAKRDGRYIERLGYYNPGTDPATIELNFDKAVDWIAKGAQPTDTCRAILSHKGVLLKHHLNTGVRKGALSEADADKKFDAWLKEKEDKIEKKRTKLESEAKSELDKRMAAEKEKNEARAKELAAKNAELAAESQQETAEVEAAEGTPEPKETTEEAPAAEAKSSSDEATEEKSSSAKATEDKKEEPKVEEKKEEKAEAKESSSAKATEDKEG